MGSLTPSESINLKASSKGIDKYSTSFLSTKIKKPVVGLGTVGTKTDILFSLIVLSEVTNPTLSISELGNFTNTVCLKETLSFLSIELLSPLIAEYICCIIGIFKNISSNLFK